MRYAEVSYSSHDGLKLFYRDYGPLESSTSPVICLPGLTRNSRDFETLAIRLAKSRRVICPDLRGRGYSEWDVDYRKYNPATYVDDIILLLEKEQISSAVIIGTSLGGLLAMVIAAMRSDLVGAIIINDAGPEVDPKGLARISQYAGVQGPVPSWEEAAAVCQRNYGTVTPGLSDEDWAQYARQSYREGEDGMLRLDMDPRIGDAVRELDSTPTDLWPVFGKLTETPILVIRGANSDILSEATVSKMNECKPDLKSATVPDRGHAPLLNEPQSMVAIDDFLSLLETQADQGPTAVRSTGSRRT